MTQARILLALFISLVLAACSLNPSLTHSNLSDQPSIIDSAQESHPAAITPVKEFESRITKKPFGIFITPETSPVQPERFSGYHTGVDVEYEDVTSRVPVLAIADGEVEYSGWVSGYGGVLAIRHTINHQKYLAIYGHLNPATLVAKGEQVIQGEQIGILGKGNSLETDGERQHLHFALYTGDDINLKGYVANSDQLSAWLDPEIFFFSQKSF